MTGRRFRFMRWSLVLTSDEPDTPAPVYVFRCAALDDADEECGAESRPSDSDTDAKRWAWAHWRENPEHTAFAETVTRPWSMFLKGPA